MVNTKYYDSIANGYNELHKAEQLKKLAIITEKLTPSNDLNTGKSIGIDVGAGTGFSLDILKNVLGGIWIGIEPSAGMVQQYTGTEQLLVSRAESLPFPDNYADRIVSITAIQNFDDSNLGINEMRRVAKDKSIIIISCLKKSPKLRKVTEEIADFFTVTEIIEEEKDIIFVCINNKPSFVEEK